MPASQRGAGMDHISLVELSRQVRQESLDGALLLRDPCDNPICRLTHDPDLGCIEVVWRKYATSAQLRFVHETLLLMLVRHQADKILGDDTDLPIIHAEDQRWIAEEWLPRARTAGLKAAASKVSMTFFGRVAIGLVQSRLARDIRISSFDNLPSARKWLKNLPSVSGCQCS